MKKKKDKIKYQDGIALVEVIAALGVAVLAITALVSLSISTLRTSLNSKLLLEGSKIANREIELVRAYRDTEGRSWADFIGAIEPSCTGTNQCHIDVSVLNVVPSPGSQGSGIETVTYFFTVSNPDGGNITVSTPIVRISVTANWIIGDDTKSAYIYTDLSNWRAR